MLHRTHSWKVIRQLAKRAGVRVICGPFGFDEQIVAVKDKAADLLAEAQAILDLCKAEDRDANEEETARFDEIMDEETGLHAQAKAEIAKLEKRQAAMDRLAQAQRPQGESNPNATVSFRDSSGRVVNALGLNDAFCPTRHSEGERPRCTLGEAIYSQLTGNAVAGIQGSVWTGSSGADYLTGSQMFGDVFDLARPETVSFAGGAQAIPMTESKLTIVQQLSDPAVHWTPELGRVPSSSLSFGRITLEPKKLACIVPVSIEIIEDAVNAPQLIQSAIVNRMAVALDQAILSGSGSAEEPLGIRNQAGVNTHTIVDAPAGDYLDLESAIELIRANDYPGETSGLSWVMNPRDASQYGRLQASDLQPLRPTPGAAALRQFQTTSLPTDLGSGSASEMIVGDLSQVIVGVRTGASVRFLPAGSVNDGSGNTINAASDFAVLIAVHLRVDVAVIRPSWITVVNGVDWS